MKFRVKIGDPDSIPKAFDDAAETARLGIDERATVERLKGLCMLLSDKFARTNGKHTTVEIDTEARTASVVCRRGNEI